MRTYPPKAYANLTEEALAVTRPIEDGEYRELKVLSYAFGFVNVYDGGTFRVDPDKPLPVPDLYIRVYGRGQGYLIRGVLVQVPSIVGDAHWEQNFYMTPRELAEKQWAGEIRKHVKAKPAKAPPGELPPIALPLRVEYTSRPEWDSKSSPHVIDANGSLFCEIPQYAKHPGIYDERADRDAKAIVTAMNLLGGVFGTFSFDWLAKNK